jgi:hypothetical protein
MTVIAVPKTNEGTSSNGNHRGYCSLMSKVMVSLPDELIQQIDVATRRLSLSRSAFLEIAARRELQRIEPSEVSEAIARSERRFLAAGKFESSVLLREERDRSQ